MGLFDIFSNQDAQNAANIEQQGLQQGYGQLSDLFSQGRGALTSYGQTGINAPTQTFNQASQGATQYGNALGLNGAAGNAQALQAFQNNPGYQFQLQQGLNAVQAQQQAQGQGGSGANQMALNNYAQGQANQGWNQYLQNLQPYLGQQTAAGGQVLAGNQNLGSGLNQSFQNQGNAAYGTQASIANAQAQAQMANYGASQNMWGALGGVANLGTSLAGMFL